MVCLVLVKRDGWIFEESNVGRCDFFVDGYLISVVVRKSERVSSEGCRARVNEVQEGLSNSHIKNVRLVAWWKWPVRLLPRYCRC